LKKGVSNHAFFFATLNQRNTFLFAAELAGRHESHRFLTFSHICDTLFRHKTHKRQTAMETGKTRSLHIDPASEADTPLILSFIKGLAEYERLAHTVAATEESLRESLFGVRRFAEVVIARLDDQPAGFALFFHNFSTFAGKSGLYLEDLFVLPEYRGKGIGKALLIHLAKLAVERKCGRFEWVVLDWNSPAIEFYKSLGAVPLDDWRQFRLSGESLNKLAGRTL
jgi:GNAT superfamily N-acetyltransferase